MIDFPNYRQLYQRHLGRRQERYCTLAAIGAMVSFFNTTTIAEEVDRNALSEFLDHPNKPIYVRGDYFKAIKVAYNEFSKTLARERTDSVAPKSSNRALSARLSKIENYDIHVEQSGGAFNVHFSPTRREPLHVVFGGSATFVVDAASFRIINKQFFK